MEHKIVFTGTMGAGKTTAIGQLSDEPPVNTDVTNTRRIDNPKAMTTAAFDYGEIDLGDNEVLRLYGTPGQDRFSFMWPVIARGALGIVYLIDCERPEPLSDLVRFIEGFGKEATTLPSVVALNKLEASDHTELAPTFQDYLELRGLDWPVVDTDVSAREPVLMLMELLLSMTEARLMEDS